MKNLLIMTVLFTSTYGFSMSRPPRMSPGQYACQWVAETQTLDPNQDEIWAPEYGEWTSPQSTLEEAEEAALEKCHNLKRRTRNCKVYKCQQGQTLINMN